MSDEDGFIFISTFLIVLLHFKINYMRKNKYFGVHFIFNVAV